MQDELRVFDFYFFGIGVVSLVSTFFFYITQFEYFYVLLFVALLDMAISIMLSMKLIRKIRQKYVWDFYSYMYTHGVMAFFASIATSLALIFFEQSVQFIGFFLVANFFVMLFVLAHLARGSELEFAAKQESRYY